MLFRILCLAVAVQLSSGATWQGYHPLKPSELAHKEGCYIQEINDVIPFGEEITPLGICYRIECTKWMLYYDSCGVVSTDDPKCHVTKTEAFRPYPECCPNVRCDIDNDII